MRKPDWLRARLAGGAGFERVNDQLNRLGLNTVCSHARCPNLAECWNAGTATFLILGDVCTRHCRFCSVRSGNPHGAVDSSEPGRVADAVLQLGLSYAVITSVDRDDLPDLGAGIFAATVQAVHRTGAAVEVLTPDFGGQSALIETVVRAGPEVFAHNLETVERLSPEVRDRRASYRNSLAVLETVKRLNPTQLTKSGLMLGLGENEEDVEAALLDLRAVDCDVVTIGQYLQPDWRCLPVARYAEPAEFEHWEQRARELGFRMVFCGPLVRSSYRAAEMAGENRKQVTARQ